MRRTKTTLEEATMKAVFLHPCGRINANTSAHLCNTLPFWHKALESKNGHVIAAWCRFNSHGPLHPKVENYHLCVLVVLVVNL
eukprot:831857-Amphidinium_carterae.1